MTARLNQFNMPPDPEIQTVTEPRFTECVSSGNGEAHSAGPPDMAKRLQELIEQIQKQPNPAARALLEECLQSLLTFYGESLSRIVGHLAEGGPEGQKILQQLAQDQSISAVLLIHGLHPIPLETRLHGALEKVRPYMKSHGGDIQLLGLENETARVKLMGTCKTCPSSAITLELAVRRAVEEACPDLLGLEVAGADQDLSTSR